jgi:peptidoglycan/xylan/chitin deacetylase (PgdA/CDA1 family)
MYHQVEISGASRNPPYVIAPDRFRQHIRALRGAGYKLCPLTDFCAWLNHRADLPGNAALLTFDDGYAGVFQHAFPFLAAEAIPFAVFVVSSEVGSEDRWLGWKRSESGRYPLMARRDLAQLARAGVGIGSHSRHHPDLCVLKPQELDDEISGSRRELEDMLGLEINCFAYPYGRLNDSIRGRVADAGYTCAFTTQCGFNSRAQDPLTIRRIDVYGTDTPRMLLRKIRYGTNDGSLLTTARYYGSRLADRLRHVRIH